MKEKRLIDANALLKKCIEGDGNDKFTEGYNFAVQEISTYITLAPTIEAEPVRRGVWVADTWCSACGRFPVDVSCHISNQELTKQFSRCPHCGSKMDGGAENAKK